MDEDRLRSERSDRKLWKSRVSGLDDFQSYGHEPPPPRRERRRHADDEDAEYRLAIEASKAEAEEEQKRRQKESMAAEEDEDLAKAIKLSREEEELRKRELEESNAQSLFDDLPAAQPQPTGYNQGYQQQGAVDWFGNPINPQQPLSTGFLNNQYAQPTGFANQPTGMPNGYTNGFQAQPTGFDMNNPYSQPQNNFLQPQTTLQPQQTAFSTNNPYGGTDMFSQQQQQPVQQMQQPQESFPTPGSHNPWAQPTQPTMDTLKPMPTGSNNPFANRTQIQRPTTSSGPPSLNTLAEERVTNNFQSSTHLNPITNYQPQLAPSKTAQPQMQHPQNPHHAQLNALLATGEGQDTFGNVGDLRIPAQHTAPGTFVNSAGQGLERLRATNTGGNNPFFTQPPTGFSQPNNNPWGGPQYQQQPQQGGSLIDL